MTIFYYSDIPFLLHWSTAPGGTSLKPFIIIHQSRQHPCAILSQLSDVCDLLYTILLHHKTGAIKCIFKVIIKTACLQPGNKRHSTYLLNLSH